VNDRSSLLRSVFIALAGIMPAGSLLAHEGHGEPAYWNSLLHHIVEPAHLLPVMAVVLMALLVLGWRVWRERRGR